MSSSRIDLAWTDPGGGTVTDTQIWRNGSLWKTVGSRLSSYQATGLSEGTSYAFKVRYVNDGTNGDFSNEDSAYTKLAAPSVLVGVKTSSSAVDLTWNDNSSHETNQRIHKNGSLFATVGADVEFYAATGVDADADSFKVQATNPAIPSSDFSNEVSPPYPE